MGLPFWRTWSGWRNELTEMLLYSTRTSAESWAWGIAMCSTAGKARDAWDVALWPELLHSNKQGMSLQCALGTRALAFCATLTRAEPDRLSEMIMPLNSALSYLHCTQFWNLCKLEWIYWVCQNCQGLKHLACEESLELFALKKPGEKKFSGEYNSNFPIVTKQFSRR